MSWKPEVQVTGEDGWHSNAMAFATEAEAKAWAQDLFNRWFVTTAFRAVEVDTEANPVNYQIVDGVLIPVVEAK